MKAKKLAAVALSLCLTVPMFSTIVSAADGSLMFSDPQTKVGEEVSVDLVVRSGNSAVGDADITMSYDTSALQFESGEGVTADSDGKLTYSGSGDGTATELRTRNIYVCRCSNTRRCDSTQCDSEAFRCNDLQAGRYRM